MLPPLYAQDPQLEVRAAFGAKVRRTVSVLLAGAPQRAAKYAALLPLAAADPCAEHRHAAYQARPRLLACTRQTCVQQMFWLQTVCQCMGSGVQSTWACGKTRKYMGAATQHN